MPFVDLYLTRRSEGDTASDRERVDLGLEGEGDLRLVSGRAELIQAVLNRLLTRQGELAGLGHPDYGSRLYLLIGQPNNQRSRAVAELYIRESLAMEPRIREIVFIAFRPPSLAADSRDRLEATLRLRSTEDDAIVTLAVQIPL